MEVTLSTWIIAVAGILIMGFLGSLQLVAVARPRSEWVIANVYGGSPDATDERAYFAFNQGWAWADALLWAPLQLAGSLGMLLGQRWGFLLALMASVPFWYSAIPIFIWDRDLGFRQNTVWYWVVVWGLFPAFGLIEGIYCLYRLL
ncbi:MAG: hypothetical protein HKP16_00755 [Xanthomonadales bacterium]|nr:hypothetical protein [Gammaproteobacteria bacterium]MBT8065501.1 hypothetical protein [Gammaproteobacteria bacterium]NNJ64067.1 hypothetical protein [Xanthomonadales bacterium]